MSLETEVAALTGATTDLLAEVVAARASLDAATAALAAMAGRVTALEARLALPTPTADDLTLISRGGTWHATDTLPI